MSTGAQGRATHPRTPKMAVGTPPPSASFGHYSSKNHPRKTPPWVRPRGGGGFGAAPPASASAAAVPAGQVDAGPRSSPLGGVAPLGEERSRKARHPSREGWRRGRWATTIRCQRRFLCMYECGAPSSPPAPRPPRGGHRPRPRGGVAPPPAQRLWGWVLSLITA